VTKFCVFSPLLSASVPCHCVIVNASIFVRRLTSCYLAGHVGNTHRTSCNKLYGRSWGCINPHCFDTALFNCLNDQWFYLNRFWLHWMQMLLLCFLSKPNCWNFKAAVTHCAEGDRMFLSALQKQTLEEFGLRACL